MEYAKFLIIISFYLEDIIMIIMFKKLHIIFKINQKYMLKLIMSI